VADKVRGILSSLKVLQETQGHQGAEEAAPGRHPVQGLRLRHHLRPAGAAGRVRADRGDRGLRPRLAGSWTPLKRYGVVAGTLLLAYKAPDIWLKNTITKRSHAIRKGLPDALDLLVICAEAGLTVDAAFGRVAKELGKAYPELGDEFALTSIELGFLTDRRMAFENLAGRIDLEAVRGVVTTMIQTEKYGTPLASALRVLSAEFRNERMMRAEEKAARLPAIMTVPLILFILPTLFIVILGPAACRIGDAFSK
jgi:tight adherence protein C